MASKREILQDPEYDNMPNELQEKRIKLMEDNVRKQTEKKIEAIVTSNFDQEINSKDAEVDALDELVNEARSMMDRFRASSVTKYYAADGKEHPPASSEHSFPSVHPTVKLYLGKFPKNQTDDPIDTENLQETSASSSESTTQLCSSKSSFDIEGTVKVEMLNVGVSPAKDGAGRAARFKTRCKIVVGNISKFILLWQRDDTDQSTHKWMVYVRGDRNNPNIEGFVKKVRFFLHPSYQPTDIVEVCNPPFHLVKRGWGEFPVRVQIHFHDPRNKPVDIIHYLKLDKTYSGLQTLGGETVMDNLYLFKADSDVNNPPASSTLSCNLKTLSKVEDRDKISVDHPSSTINNPNNTDVNMELSHSASATENKTVPIPRNRISNIPDVASPSITLNGIQPESKENGENRTLVSKATASKPSVVNSLQPKTIPNGVNTAYLKCTDTEGRVLLVPQSSLLCIKPPKPNAKLDVNNSASRADNDSGKLLNANKSTVPSYILKVVPNQDSGKNQVLLIPMSEKKVQNVNDKVALVPSKENGYKTNNGNQSSAEEPSKKLFTGPFWVKDLMNIRCEEYKSFPELLKRFCMAIPLCKTGVDRTIYPFCSSSHEVFLRWNIGKQRAAEWRRAGIVRTALLNFLRKRKHPSITEDSVWPRHVIMTWCRKNGFVPMTSEKMTLLPEPKWSGVELCSITSADHLRSNLKKEQKFKILPNEDDTEIEILEDISEKPVKINNQNQQSQAHLPYLNSAASYVKELTTQIGVNIRPLELEKSVFLPAVEEMILSACKSLASDLIRSSVSEGYRRVGGQFCPEEVTLSDVYSTIKETPQFDFLSNSYLGMPKEPRGDT